jgi:hypothetical protein
MDIKGPRRHNHRRWGVRKGEYDNRNHNPERVCVSIPRPVALFCDPGLSQLGRGRVSFGSNPSRRFLAFPVQLPAKLQVETSGLVATRKIKKQSTEIAPVPCLRALPRRAKLLPWQTRCTVVTHRSPRSRYPKRSNSEARG